VTYYVCKTFDTDTSLAWVSLPNLNQSPSVGSLSFYAQGSGTRTDLQLDLNRNLLAVNTNPGGDRSNDSIFLFDITNRTNPSLLSIIQKHIGFPAQISYIGLSGNTLVASFYAAFPAITCFYDITNPASPALTQCVGTLGTLEIGFFLPLTAGKAGSQDVAYGRGFDNTSSVGNTLLAINITNPTSPSPIGALGVPLNFINSRDIIIHKNLVIVHSKTVGLGQTIPYYIGIVDRLTMTLLAEITTSPISSTDQILSIAALPNRDILFASINNIGIDVYDISTPSNPVFLERISTAVRYDHISAYEVQPSGSIVAGITILSGPTQRLDLIYTTH
jgi:hypothetical protein